MVFGMRFNPVHVLLFLLLASSAVAAGESRPAKWRVRTGDFVYSTPAIGEGTAFVGSGDGYLYAIDVESGMVKWSYPVGGSIEASPKYSEGVVYFGSSDNSIYALNASEGAQRLKWSFRTGGPVYSSPTVAGDMLYFGSTDGDVYALRNSNGTQKWNFSTGGPVFSSPCISAGTVYAGSDDGSLYALNASNGTQIWSYRTYGPVRSSPQVFNNVVYFGSYDSQVYALDAFTGALIWSFPTGGKIDSSPAVSSSILWIGSSDGRLYAINAFNGTKWWDYSVNKSIESAPYYSEYNKAVYFGAKDNSVHALDAVTGKKLWSFATGGVVASSPAVTGSLVVFGSFDSNVYAVSTISSSIAYPANDQNVNSMTLVINGTADADGGVKLVEVQVGADPAWHTATGTENWSYTWSLSSQGSGRKQIRVRATDNRDEQEKAPYANVSVVLNAPTPPPTFPVRVTFPEYVKPGDTVTIIVSYANGTGVPYVRVELAGKTFYDRDGDGRVDSDDNGEPVFINQTSGDLPFTVAKDGVTLVANQPLVMRVSAQGENYAAYIAAATLAVVGLVALYLLKKRRAPRYG